MKSITGLLLAIAAVYPLASRASAADSPGEQKAVLASFQGFLDGLGRRDKPTMVANSLPGGSVTLMRNGKPLQMSLDSLADRLSQPGNDTHEERIKDALVRVDGDVAIVWAPFEFLINGKVDHCGRDIANLVKVDGKWLISAIQDNSRTSCGQK